MGNEIDTTRRALVIGGLASLFTTPAKAQIFGFGRNEMLDPQIRPGSRRIGGDLTNLQFYESDRTNHGLSGRVGNQLDGQYLLIYFGAPYSLSDENSCAIDLPLMNATVEELEDRYGAEFALRITPVFIFPEHNPSKHSAAVNIRAYLEPSNGTHLIGLSATESQYDELAGDFAVRMRKNPDGTISSHTRFTYLMNPKGENIAIFPSDMVPYTLMIDQTATLMAKDPTVRMSPNQRQALEQ